MNMGSHMWHGKTRHGITLIEVLIVVGIIALLLQLIMPAIEAAREPARQVQCKNNLRQIALAISLHHDTYKRFPSGGWMYRWVGEPERGTDVDQPGSWIFNVLTFVEEVDLRRMGEGMTDKEREKAISDRCETPLPLFVCPSRRIAKSWPAVDPPTFLPLLTNGSTGFMPARSARSDYAACVGDAQQLGMRKPTAYGLSPLTLEQGDDPAFPWNVEEKYTGVIFRRSHVDLAQVTDGASKTYLVGEKYIDSATYKTGTDRGDNCNMFCAQGLDNYRTTAQAPFRDERDVKHWWSFGSTHPGGFHMAFCDGSVRRIAYDIDPTVHRRLGNRADGEAVSQGDFGSE